jgi:predicted NBD/HSP70 family sugar kinase
VVTAARAGRTQEEVRRHNLSTILREVHERGARSRAQLTEATGLNRSTIGVLASELAAAGLVREVAPVAKGGAGRPSFVVRPAKDVYVVAVDVGVDVLSAARVGLDGAVRAQSRMLQRRSNPSVTTVVKRLGRLVDEVVADAPAGATCVGVGASVCGTVRISDGMVRLSPNLGWVDVPLGRALSDRLGLQVPYALGNDADLGALAEMTRGTARGCQDVVYLSGEVGLGGGIVTSGRPLGGSGGYAGEVGHVIVNAKGRRCRCGARGCWETEVGEDALLAHVESDRERGRGAAEAVIRAAAEGDRQARKVVDRVGWWLGVGIGNLVNIFNPEVVVLGGLLHDLYPIAQHRVQEGVAAVTLQAPGEVVRLSVSELASGAPLMGAAELAFEPLIADPLGALEHQAS